jgi:predicted polyphosphate/ATP-dependent NAD kinase
MGLIVNPLAGMGGSLALKGSDGSEVRALASELDPNELTRAMERVQRTLVVLTEAQVSCEILTCDGAMGQQVLEACGFDYSLCPPGPRSPLSTGEDTQRAARSMRDDGVDIIVFAGGDGTARDLYDAVGDKFPVLGIPAGVKMHSGAFAVSPEAAGELLVELCRGGLVGLSLQEIRDIDEEAFRDDRVVTRFYGEMLVPGEGRYLQHTKVGGREDAGLVALDIAAWVVEQMAEESEEDVTYLVGPGSTTAAIMSELGLPNTLLGVDVIRDGVVELSDASETGLLNLLGQTRGPAKIIVTVIGGQGYLFGRGNQQFSPAVIRTVGLENICIVAAKSKLAALEDRSLLVDTNDPALDEALSGYRPIITGYRDQVLYRLGTRA